MNLTAVDVKSVCFDPSKLKNEVKLIPCGDRGFGQQVTAKVTICSCKAFTELFSPGHPFFDGFSPRMQCTGFNLEQITFKGKIKGNDVVFLFSQIESLVEINSMKPKLEFVDSVIDEKTMSRVQNFAERYQLTMVKTSKLRTETILTKPSLQNA